ncbi:hypothetical protein PGT21_009904 [Puccinia graminis f. sp. tritici]|uniref:Uncharacterized protein n=3 Tax=Puccinia graminis f. sp. tritici TaxID=56615 RepID=H6QPF3_PUCGT|nr:uncharacterized protein PGTG_20883 [Puccinia graminis f. sp. tritici CRL 75-36-700-3]EHS63901.1 hypothetical protein PGTG_20883 [Puccinia graminis f. sp. tritici CRL 75-36-700-3]KAA1079389.1 hypothetical protein PGT21_009904 [Puccinia graminis f. sp. tritici]KAA1082138.1 hypothetical protein PGTUg99_022798 [Puccinia graminis f. sp. tritici]
MNIIKLACFALAVAFKLETVESKDCGGAPGWEHACIFDHYTDKIRKKVYRAENVRCRREEIDICCPPGKLVDLKFVLVEQAWKMHCEGQAI